MTEDKTTPELLSEMTGRPEHEFEIDEDEYEFPSLDELDVRVVND